MDPNATLRKWREGTRTERIEAREDLRRWIECGGYAPHWTDAEYVAIMRDDRPTIGTALSGQKEGKMSNECKSARRCEHDALYLSAVRKGEGIETHCAADHVTFEHAVRHANGQWSAMVVAQLSLTDAEAMAHAIMAHIEAVKVGERA